MSVTVELADARIYDTLTFDVAGPTTPEGFTSWQKQDSSAAARVPADHGIPPGFLHENSNSDL